MLYENINIVDLISLIIILLSILASAWRGLIRETMTVIIWLSSFLVSKIFFKYVSSYTRNFIQIDILVQLISWVIPFLITVILFSILNNIIVLPPLLKFSNIYDHILGSIFGFVRGILIIVLIYIGIIQVIENVNKLPEQILDSYTVNISSTFSKYIIEIIPYDNLNRYEKKKI